MSCATSSSKVRRRGAAALLAASLLAGGLAGPDAQATSCPPGTPAEHTAADRVIRSFDGTPIAVTVFQPADVCAEDPTPILLHGHGWGGSRHETIAPVTVWLDAGYGVVSVDARGHGGSGGQATVMHPEAEVRDYVAVLDFITDELDWVTRSDEEIVAGAIGNSYGGAFQLMTAAFDDRLDAIVPENTWHDLPHSLAPHGVPRSMWISFLHLAGRTAVSLDPRLDRWFSEMNATGEVSSEALEHFREASPASYLEEIEVPALFVQGMPDTLFPLNEAVGGFLGLREQGAEAWLVAYHGGHMLPGAIPPPPHAACGQLDALKLTFLDAHLKEDPHARARIDATPRVQIPTEQGECLEGDGWPLGDVDVPVMLGDLVVPERHEPALIEIFEAERQTTVVGIPRLRGVARFDTTEDEVLYVGLVVESGGEYVSVNDQVMPIRVAAAGGATFELAAVATTVAPGERLSLWVSAADDRFERVTESQPGTVLLEDTELTVSLVGSGAEPNVVPNRALVPTVVGGVALVLLLAIVVFWLRRRSAARRRRVS